MSNGNMVSITNYPMRTVIGMYKQEQELAKADEAGLILTAADLKPLHCYECGGDIEDMRVASSFDDLNWAHDECLMKHK